jgi:ribosomal protein L24
MSLPEKTVPLPQPKDWVEIIEGKLRGKRGRVYSVYERKVEVEYTRTRDDGTVATDSIQIDAERVRVLTAVP